MFFGDELDEYFENMKTPPSIVVKIAYGLIGFVKFLKGYYIVLITEKKKIAKIGRHSIYKVKDMSVRPLFKLQNNHNNEEEAKYVEAFKDIQISKGFYFSYTYDITHSLQFNVLRQINISGQKQQYSENESKDNERKTSRKTENHA